MVAASVLHERTRCVGGAGSMAEAGGQKKLGSQLVRSYGVAVEVGCS